MGLATNPKSNIFKHGSIDPIFITSISIMLLIGAVVSVLNQRITQENTENRSQAEQTVQSETYPCKYCILNICKIVASYPHCDESKNPCNSDLDCQISVPTVTPTQTPTPNPCCSGPYACQYITNESNCLANTTCSWTCIRTIFPTKTPMPTITPKPSITPTTCCSGPFSCSYLSEGSCLANSSCTWTCQRTILPTNTPPGCQPNQKRCCAVSLVGSSVGNQICENGSWSRCTPCNTNTCRQGVCLNNTPTPTPNRTCTYPQDCLRSFPDNPKFCGFIVNRTYDGYDSVYTSCYLKAQCIGGTCQLTSGAQNDPSNDLNHTCPEACPNLSYVPGRAPSYTPTPSTRPSPTKIPTNICVEGNQQYSLDDYFCLNSLCYQCQGTYKTLISSTSNQYHLCPCSPDFKPLPTVKPSPLPTTPHTCNFSIPFSTICLFYAPSPTPIKSYLPAIQNAPSPTPSPIPPSPTPECTTNLFSTSSQICCAGYVKTIAVPPLLYYCLKQTTSSPSSNLPVVLVESTPTPSPRTLTQTSQSTSPEPTPTPCNANTYALSLTPGGRLWLEFITLTRFNGCYQPPENPPTSGFNTGPLPSLTPLPINCDGPEDQGYYKCDGQKLLLCNGYEWILKQDCESEGNTCDTYNNSLSGGCAK